MLVDVVSKCDEGEVTDPQVHARALSALGKLYEMQEQKTTAIRCYEKCLEIRHKTLGENHESTILVRDRLANLVLYKLST